MPITFIMVNIACDLKYSCSILETSSFYGWQDIMLIWRQLPRRMRKYGIPCALFLAPCRLFCSLQNRLCMFVQVIYIFTHFLKTEANVSNPYASFCSSWNAIPHWCTGTRIPDIIVLRKGENWKQFYINELSSMGLQNK